MLKAKSILILSEIAYQPLKNSHLVFISKILSIPKQTISDEIKRLVKLNYLQFERKNETLFDSRFKHYSLTEKGIILLHLFTESTRLALIQVHKDSLGQY